MTDEELWRAALGEIELSISRANFITWFKGTVILSNTDNRVVLGVPNGFAKEWLENKYNLYILRALRNFQSNIREVVCVIGSNQESVPKEPSVDAILPQKKLSPALIVEAPKSVSLSPENNLNPKYTFENFVVGSNNELARAACYAVSQNLGQIYNPLFIYGGVGLGKTHLLQSIGNAILQNNPARKVKYITSERFTNELITALKTHTIDAFKEHYQKIDLLIIDDVQFLSGKEKTQEEFFHIFNHLYQLNKQVVLSSDRAPKAIPTLEERLRSRFEGGMIADVSMANYETRLAILSKKAMDDKIAISSEALGFIAQYITNNIRELEGALNRVAVSAQLSKQELTLEYVSSLLVDLISSGKKKGITYKHILEAISSFYAIGVDDLVAKNRKKEVSRPRQIAMYLMRSELQCSYPGIGERLGGRDHTTAIHAFDKISKELNSNEKLAEDIVLIKEQLYKIT